MRLDRKDRGAGQLRGELFGDVQRRRLAQVVDVRLERETEAGDRGALAVGALAELLEGRLDLADDRLRTGVVGLSCGPDEPGLLRCGRDDEPWVDGDAVATHTGTGVEDVDPRVTVGEANDLPHVEAELLTDLRQLVREGDVDVTEGVLRQLGHLGRGRVGEQDLAGDEGAVQLGCLLGTGRGQAADDPVVAEDLDHDAAGQHSLGAVRQVHVRHVVLVRELQVGTQLGEPPADLEGRPGWGRGLEDDDLAAPELGGDRLGGRANVGEVRLVVALERRGHGDEVDRGLRRLGAGTQQALAHRLRDGLVEVRLDDRHPARIDLVDRVLVDVDTLEGEALPSERGARRQTDVAEADDRDSVMEHGLSLRGLGKRAGQLYPPGWVDPSVVPTPGDPGWAWGSSPMTARTASTKASCIDRQSWCSRA